MKKLLMVRNGSITVILFFNSETNLRRNYSNKIYRVVKTYSQIKQINKLEWRELLYPRHSIWKIEISVNE